MHYSGSGCGPAELTPLPGVHAVRPGRSVPVCPSGPRSPETALAGGAGHRSAIAPTPTRCPDRGEEVLEVVSGEAGAPLTATARGRR